MSRLQPPLLTPPSPAREACDLSEAAERRIFWRDFRIIAAAHVVILLVLFLAGILRPKQKPDQVLWLDGGSLGGGESAAAAPEIEKADPPPNEPEPEVPVPNPPSEEKIARSEIVEPRATPAPATPKPVPPKPATPKPATPKPKEPKTTPRPAASPKPNATPEGKAKASPSPEKTKTQNGESKIGTKDAKSDNPTGSGSGGISQFGWYTDMLHDRYYSRWEQPVGIGQDVITTVKLRIMKDGTIAKHDFVKSSGNPQMDESVMSAVQKVLQIDPLPAGLGNGEYFDLNVNFKVGE